MSCPPSVTVPEVGGRSPESRLVSVDLPAPLGPMTAWMWLRQRSTDTSFTAARPPKRLVRFFALRSSSVMANLRLVFALGEFFNQAQDAARRKRDQQHNEEAHPQLPVLAQVDAADLRQVLEDMQQIFKRKRADDGAGKVAHAAEDHHHDGVRAHVKTHELGVDVACL